MTERWVKATTAQGDEIWVDMGKPSHNRMQRLKSDKGTMVNGDLYREPPDHFLPPRDYALNIAMGFLREIATAETCYGVTIPKEIGDLARRMLKEIEG